MPKSVTFNRPMPIQRGGHNRQFASPKTRSDPKGLKPAPLNWTERLPKGLPPLPGPKK